MQHTGRTRQKSRHKFRKNVRLKGKISITNFFQEFIKGDHIVLKAEPAYQKGLYHARFHGKAGRISKKRGNCYEVLIKDFNKLKTLILHPIHLKKINNDRSKDN
ncbi:50S ribosomal protein L21e [Candidatus Woesearchaeota archaeon]|nr:50S ribosomal protein L21e [Candidatus Woesearchaeota archaeon]